MYKLPASLVALLVLIPFAHADQAAPTTFVGEHYEGTIAGFDPSTGSGTLTTRFSQRALPIRITSDTRIWKTVRLAPASLEPGQTIVVLGRKTKSDDRLEPQLIDILPGMPARRESGPKIGGGREIVVFGTVATVGDDLTMTSREGKSYALEIKGNFILVGQTVPTDMSEITDGASIKVDGAVDSGTFVVKRVILPVSIRRRQDRSRSQAAPANAQPVTITEDDITMYDLL